MPSLNDIQHIISKIKVSGKEIPISKSIVSNYSNNNIEIRLVQPAHGYKYRLVNIDANPQGNDGWKFTAASEINFWMSPLETTRFNWMARKFQSFCQFK